MNQNGLTLINWNLNGVFDNNTPLAHLTFNKIGNESESIIISNESIIRNSNNEDIQVDSLYRAYIEVDK